MGDDAAAKLARRRKLYSRLLEMREDLSGAELQSTEEGLQLCRQRLTESINAATAQHSAVRGPRSSLHALCTNTPSEMSEAHAALTTLSTWAKRLRGELRVQKKVVGRLQRAADILRLIAAIADGQPLDGGKGMAGDLLSDTWSKACGNIAPRPWESACAFRSRHIRKLSGVAAELLAAALEDSRYLQERMDLSSHADIIVRLSARARRISSFELFTRSRPATTNRFEGTAQEARGDCVAVEDLCKEVTQFLLSCDEELLLTTAIGAELTDDVHNRRLSNAPYQMCNPSISAQFGGLIS